VTVPVRAGPVFADAFTTTVPLPLPLDPDATVSQLVVVEAVHGHPAPAVTVTLMPVVATAAIDRLVGLMVMGEQAPGPGGGGGGGVAVAPSCTIATATPPTVMAPLRSEPVFAAMVNASVPAPLPEAGVNVIQLTFVDGLQGQPAGADNAIVPAPPAAANLVALGVAAN
jgi:hypothetical protein